MANAPKTDDELEAQAKGAAAVFFEFVTDFLEGKRVVIILDANGQDLFRVRIQPPV